MTDENILKEIALGKKILEFFDDRIPISEKRPIFSPVNIDDAVKASSALYEMGTFAEDKISNAIKRNLPNYFHTLAEGYYTLAYLVTIENHGQENADENAVAYFKLITVNNPYFKEYITGPYKLTNLYFPDLETSGAKKIVELTEILSEGLGEKCNSIEEYKSYALAYLQMATLGLAEMLLDKEVDYLDTMLPNEQVESLNLDRYVKQIGERIIERFNDSHKTSLSSYDEIKDQTILHIVE